jgi:hypothetical protein
MPTYHLFVWVCSFAFAIPTLLDSQVAGYWFVSSDVDNIGLCWINSRKGLNVTKSIYIWFMFIIPLGFVYAFSCIALVVAYRRLKHGISNTIIHRMKALVINSINVSVYIIYWMTLLIPLVISFFLNDNMPAGWAFKIILFMMASKGVSAVFVWILTQDVQFGKNSDRVKDDEGVDLNGALRQELLYFATSGIRMCASKGCDLRPEQKKLCIQLEHRPQRSDVELSPWFFIFLILGREEERNKIAKLATAAQRKTIPIPLSPIEEETMRSEALSISEDISFLGSGSLCYDGPPSMVGVESDLRLSQRCV